MEPVTGQEPHASAHPTESADVLSLPLRQVFALDPACLADLLLNNRKCSEDLVKAISAARAEGLSLSEIQAADVAHALACRVHFFEEYRSKHKRSLKKIAMKLDWSPDKNFSQVWDALVKNQTLPILAWVCACEENADWKRAESDLTLDNAKQAQKDFCDVIPKDEDSSGWLDFYDRFLSATALEHFMFGNPKLWIVKTRPKEIALEYKKKVVRDLAIGTKRIHSGMAKAVVDDCDVAISDKTESSSLNLGPSAGAAEQGGCGAAFWQEYLLENWADSPRVSKLAESLKDVGPGVLGEKLRALGLKHILLLACQRIAREAPKRAVLFWLYHSVATEQDDLIEAGFANAPSLVSQETKQKGSVNRRIQFWESFVEVVDGKAEKATQQQQVYAFIQFVAHRVLDHLKEEKP